MEEEARAFAWLLEVAPFLPRKTASFLELAKREQRSWEEES